MNKKIIVEVYRQNIRVYIPNNIKNIMNDFTSRLISYSKMYDKRKKRYIGILDKKWWVQRNLGSETLFIFQLEILRDLMLFFRIQGVDMLNENNFVIKNKNIEYSKANMKLKPHFVLRDYQLKYVGTVCDNNMRKALIELQTGSGKTIIGLSIVSERKKTTGILLSGYLDKWEGDVLNTLEIDTKKIYIIQGFTSIDKLMQQYKMFGKLDYELYIIAGTTFANFVRDSEAGKVDYKPEEFLEILNIGTLLIDEIHERFFTVHQFCLYANPEVIVGMTATFTSSNEYVKKFQQMTFPLPTRLNFVPIRKYINTLAVQYTLANPESAKYKNGAMYSHDIYETATIIKYKTRLLNYIEMIEHYIDTEYLDKNYKKGDKLVIFVASIRFATMLTEYLKNVYPNLDIKRYVGEDEYENVITPDVRVSTMQSAGTAIDIPGLTVVLNTVLAKSPVRNKQSHGRLREIEDTEVRYIYFYCKNIQKHKEFNATRTEQLTPYSKTYRTVEYIKKI